MVKAEVNKSQSPTSGKSNSGKLTRSPTFRRKAPEKSNGSDSEFSDEPRTSIEVAESTEQEAYNALVYLVLADLCMVEYFPESAIGAIGEKSDLKDFQCNIDHVANQQTFESSKDMKDFVVCCQLAGYSFDDVFRFFTIKKERPDVEKLTEWKPFLASCQYSYFLKDTSKHSEKLSQYDEYLLKKDAWEENRQTGK